MRIGVFLAKTGTQAGGLETYERSLVRGLAEVDRENEYHLFCASASAPGVLGLDQPNFHCHVLRPASRWISIPLTLPIASARRHVDLLHATFVPPPYSPRPLVFTMQEPAVFKFRDFWPLRIRLRMVPLMTRGIRTARLIICVSETTRDFVAERFGIPLEAMAVVYNGCGEQYRVMDRQVARDCVAETLGIRDPYVVYAGRLEPRKNPVRMLRAFDRFRRQVDAPVKFVLAGAKTWSAKQVDAVIRELGLAEHVVELGYVTPEHLPALYGAAEMLVYATLWEGFGLPPVEAMACGTPVLTSDTSCMPEVTGGAALLVDPYSVEDIAAGMHKLFTDTALRAELRARGLERAKVFTWEQSARQTVKAYEQAAAL